MENKLITIFIALIIGICFLVVIADNSAQNVIIFTSSNETLDITPAKYLTWHIITGINNCNETNCSGCSEIFNGSSSSWSYLDTKCAGVGTGLYYVYNYSICNSTSLFGSSYTTDCANVYYQNATTYYVNQTGGNASSGGYSLSPSGLTPDVYETWFSGANLNIVSTGDGYVKGDIWAGTPVQKFIFNIGSPNNYTISINFTAKGYCSSDTGNLYALYLYNQDTDSWLNTTKFHTTSTSAQISYSLTTNFINYTRDGNIYALVVGSNGGGGNYCITNFTSLNINITGDSYYCPSAMGLGRNITESDCKCIEGGNGCLLNNTSLFSFNSSYFTWINYSLSHINSSIRLSIAKIADVSSPSECLSGNNAFTLLNQTNSTQTKNKDYNITSIGYIYLNNSISLNSTDKAYVTYTYCNANYLGTSWARIIISITIGLLAIILLAVSAVVLWIFYTNGKI